MDFFHRLHAHRVRSDGATNTISLDKLGVTFVQSNS
jgi:hypothetical protein